MKFIIKVHDLAIPENVKIRLFRHVGYMSEHIGETHFNKF